MINSVHMKVILLIIVVYFLNNKYDNRNNYKNYTQAIYSELNDKTVLAYCIYDTSWYSDNSNYVQTSDWNCGNTYYGPVIKCPPPTKMTKLQTERVIDTQNKNNINCPCNFGSETKWCDLYKLKLKT